LGDESLRPLVFFEATRPLYLLTPRWRADQGMKNRTARDSAIRISNLFSNLCSRAAFERDFAIGRPCTIKVAARIIGQT
jgi:hypothetical protein